MRKKIVTGCLVLASCIGVTQAAFCADEAALVPVAQDEKVIVESAGSPGTSAADKEMLDKVAGLSPKLQAEEWVKRLAVLESQKDYAGLRSSVSNFYLWLQLNKSKDGDVYKNNIVQVYKFNAAGLCGQGYYATAATAVRNGYQTAKAANAKVDGLLELAIQCDAQKVTRDEYYRTIRTYQNAKAEMNKALLDLMTQKQKIIDELLQSGRKLTSDTLKALQDKIKELNTKITSKRLEIAKADVAHTAILDDKKYAGIILNPQLTANIEAAEKAHQEMESRITSIEVSVQKGLLTLAEKAAHSWEGLEGRMSELSKLQKEINDLQKELLALLAKKPYSDDAKASIRKLNARLGKLSAEFAKNMVGIEDDFMNAKTFNALAAKEMLAFKEQLVVLMKAGDEIEQTNAQIEKLIVAMEKETAKLGDLNGDGKIDVKDLLVLVRNLGKNASVMPSADLDGDGKISITDYLFIREAVLSGRTVFPADKNYQQGDLNGDGRIDWADLLKLAQVTHQAGKNGIHFVSSPWLDQYDINGDKVINTEDFQALVGTMTASQSGIIQTSDTTASSTVISSATEPVANPASAAVGTPVRDDHTPILHIPEHPRHRNAQPAGTMGDN